MVVDHAVVEGFDVGLGDDFEGAAWCHGETEVAGKAVAAAAGDDAEGYGGVDGGAGDLVDGAVASDGYGDVGVMVDGLTGELGGVTGVLGVVYGGVKVCGVKQLGYCLDYLVFAACP